MLRHEIETQVNTRFTEITDVMRRWAENYSRTYDCVIEVNTDATLAKFIIKGTGETLMSVLQTITRAGYLG